MESNTVTQSLSNSHFAQERELTDCDYLNSKTLLGNFVEFRLLLQSKTVNSLMLLMHYLCALYLWIYRD